MASSCFFVSLKYHKPCRIWLINMYTILTKVRYAGTICIRQNMALKYQLPFFKVVRLFFRRLSFSKATEKHVTYYIHVYKKLIYGENLLIAIMKRGFPGAKPTLFYLHVFNFSQLGTVHLGL